MGCNCDPNGPNMDRNLGLHILSHSAHIGVHGEPFRSYVDPFPYPSECTWGSFGSQLRPIQHPSGDRGAHSHRSCTPFSTHRCVREPVFDVPKKMTQTKTLVFSVLAVPKFWDAKNLSHTATIFAVCWDFGEVAATKNSRHVPRLPPCSALLGFVDATHAAGAQMELKWAE